MTVDDTDVLMCPACGYELVVKAVAVTIVEDFINDTTETIYALAYPWHEGNVRTGDECRLSMKLVDAELREKYK